MNVRMQKPEELIAALKRCCRELRARNATLERVAQAAQRMAVAPGPDSLVKLNAAVKELD
jgi:hypothetical protein